MKKLLFTLIIFTTISELKSQTIVWNDKLFAQIAKNQTVRLASNQSLFNSYEKQREMYDKVNQKVNQIVAIQAFIYNNLYNINSALLQGKQLFYIYQRFEQIGQTASIVLSYTTKKPEFAVLLYKYYADIVNQLIQLKTQLAQEILKEGNDFLMDSMDRAGLIDIIRVKANTIYGDLLYIKWMLEASKDTPYLYQIPYLNNYISLDKIIVKEIIRKWNVIFL